MSCCCYYPRQINSNCYNPCCRNTTSYLPVQPTPIIPPTPIVTGINQNATIYNASAQTITSGTALTLPTTLTNNGLTIGTNSITVPTAGTYIVSYTVNDATGATGSDNIAIAVNGTIISATAQPLSASESKSGTYVLSLSAGSTLTLVPTVTSATGIVATGGPSATLTAVRIY